MLTRLRKIFSKYIEYIAKILSKTGLTPNHITILSLPVSLLALYAALNNDIIAFAILILVTGFLDVLDGALARITGKVTKFGAFLDSSIDRIVDGLFILSLYYVLKVSVIEVFILILVSFMISYTRARAEALGIKMEGIGLIERAERILFIFSIAILSIYNKFTAIVVFYVLLILSVITVIQRIYYVYKVLGQVR
ncbi:CDP-alcohol phosphatidyltransferase family protein [Desulfurococcaceae archaeon MEX13E-LK6-19]|nr:CDP-alcohol phosphatidyltransferase family protein [Desulfurococcaceae archaeon MEX13E-LK6-19]